MNNVKAKASFNLFIVSPPYVSKKLQKITFANTYPQYNNNNVLRQYCVGTARARYVLQTGSCAYSETTYNY